MGAADGVHERCADAASTSAGVDRDVLKREFIGRDGEGREGDHVAVGDTDDLKGGQLRVADVPESVVSHPRRLMEQGPERRTLDFGSGERVDEWSHGLTPLWSVARMGASKRKPEPTWPSSHLRTTWLHRCPAGMTVVALSSPASCLRPLLRIGAGSAKSRPSSDAAMRAVSSSLPPLARIPRVRAKSTSSVLSQYQRWNSSEERPGTRSGRDDAG